MGINSAFKGLIP